MFAAVLAGGGGVLTRSLAVARCSPRVSIQRSFAPRRIVAARAIDLPAQSVLLALSPAATREVRPSLAE